MMGAMELHTIYAVVVGSRAYGLAGPDSDTDRRGVFLAPTPAYWGLDQPPSHVEGPGEDFAWEVERFCRLALQANPTVLECLWSPLVEQVDDTGAELVRLRGAFLSRRVAQTYGGYARDQMTRVASARARTGTIRWKQAMHMLRLLIAGEHTLRTGEVMVDVGADRDALLAVRRGEVPFSEVEAWAERLTTAMGSAEAASELPDEPDRSAVSAFLVATRRAHL